MMAVFRPNPKAVGNSPCGNLIGFCDAHTPDGQMVHGSAGCVLTISYSRRSMIASLAALSIKRRFGDL